MKLIQFSNGSYGVMRETVSWWGTKREFLSPNTGYWYEKPEMVNLWCQMSKYKAEEFIEFGTGRLTEITYKEVG